MEERGGGGVGEELVFTWDGDEEDNSILGMGVGGEGYCFFFNFKIILFFYCWEVKNNFWTHMTSVII